ncbi:DNA-binding IclR family transcriptional regulator [Bacillus pakistanensis]|uniref:DNA-binding IclR family transcriptional regulator n=1 Tax=Rossellomorea pakistanensis TaxID=992288 RepID=A0ABS2N7E6_9BACI|nr:IclR family transcriptional regulator [Bacillus pakistanensis]MBM7583776.1 DNA-binding IclR family transcriptional regulator [Bacillus pakistanensis]
MISSVKKISKILNCFTNDEPALGNLEIAEKLGMNPSTVHHLVRTLCEEGMLIQDSRKKYRLGWKLLEWSNHVMYQQDIYSEATPFCEGLIRRYHGIVHIGMFDAGEVRFVLKVKSKSSLPVPTYVGATKPAYCTSTGKVLLAFNPSLIKPTIAKGLLQRAPNTITCVSKLKEELKQIKLQGYAISNNENELGLYGIAAPIRSYTGQTIAALNMVGPISYMDGNNRYEMIKSVVSTAEKISKDIGYISVL